MNKKIIFLILFLLIISSTGLNAGTTRPNLLRDGFVLRGIDGTLTGPDSKDTWFFEPASDITDRDIVVKAGTKLELLPSSALEMMITHSKTYAAATYQLWNSTVTRYKGRNYIFPAYFLPVSLKDTKSEPNETTPEEKPAQDSADNTSDRPSIPPDIMKKIEAAREEMFRTSQRIPDSDIITIDDNQKIAKSRKTAIVDSILVGRTAILVKQKNNRYEFTLDSIGRNVQNDSFRLLPCEELEKTEQKQSANPEPMRFNIAGILTKYKSNNYLLLNKATEIYSHGNFGR
jgi:hypothetical protein